MSLIEAIILGIVQGLTEFLPVSSSGHIEIFKVIFGQQAEEGLFFTLVLHAATALSTLVVFRKEIGLLVSGIFSRSGAGSRKEAYLIILSMIPAVLVGLFLEDKISALFNGNLLLVGLCLLVTGFILFYSDRFKDSGNEVNPKTAMGIGIIQAIAILPGISRSGSTIAGGVMLGIGRNKVAGFSFIMVLPLILGASLKKVLDYQSTGISEALPSMTIMIAAFAAAFIAGLFACRWMINLVKRSKLKWFSYYCWLVGAIAVAWYFLQN